MAGLIREELDEAVKLTLIRAKDDPGKYSAEFQRELADVIKALRAAGVRLSPAYFTMDAVNAGGGLTGELTVLAPTLKLAASILIAFLGGRYGRKVRLKVGEIEAEGRTPKEVQKLLTMAREYKKADEPKRIIGG